MLTHSEIHIDSNPLIMKLIISPTSFPLNNGKLKIVIVNGKTKEPIEKSLNIEKNINLDNLSQSFQLSEEIKLEHPQQVYLYENIDL